MTGSTSLYIKTTKIGNLDYEKEYKGIL
jgi:hypothetical protein